MKILVAIFFLYLQFSFFAEAQVTTPLPEARSLDLMITSFRQSLQIKLFEMTKYYRYNFIPSEKGFILNYIVTDKTFFCSYMEKKQYESTSQVVYRYKKETRATEEVLTEFIYYYGCMPEPLLIEVFETHGAGLQPLDAEKVVQGSRVFELKSNETERKYQLLDSSQRVLLSYVDRITNKTETTKNEDIWISFFNVPFLTLQYKLAPLKSTLTYIFEALPKLPDYFLRSQALKFPAKEQAIFFLEGTKASSTDFLIMNYRDSKGNIISKGNFNRLFDENFLGPAGGASTGYLRNLNSIIQSNLAVYPTTSLVFTGLPALFDDITGIIEMLSTGKQNVAIQLLQIIQESIKNGEIIDNRKKK